MTKPAFNPLIVFAIASDGKTEEVKDHPWASKPRKAKPDANEEKPQRDVPGAARIQGRARSRR